MSQYNYPSYPGAFAHQAPPVPPVPPQEKRHSGMAALALVLALLALAIGWVPVIGLIMMIPALLAVLLALIAFVSAIVVRRTGAMLPVFAAVVGVAAFVVPPVSTGIAALSLVPYGYTVGMDQVQIELEHDLKRQGVPREQAERISQNVGDVLRSYARPSQWREGIGAAHRFGLLCEDYQRTLRSIPEEDADARQAAAADFRDELARLAERQGIELEDEDLDLLAEIIGRDHVRKAGNWNQSQRRAHQQRRMVLQSEVGATPRGTCPASGCD